MIISAPGAAGLPPEPPDCVALAPLPSHGRLGPAPPRYLGEAQPDDHAVEPEARIAVGAEERDVNRARGLLERVVDEAVASRERGLLGAPGIAVGCGNGRRRVSRVGLQDSIAAPDHLRRAVGAAEDGDAAVAGDGSA